MQSIGRLLSFKSLRVKSCLLCEHCLTLDRDEVVKQV